MTKLLVVIMVALCAVRPELILALAAVFVVNIAIAVSVEVLVA